VCIWGCVIWGQTLVCHTFRSASLCVNQHVCMKCVCFRLVVGLRISVSLMMKMSESYKLASIILLLAYWLLVAYCMCVCVLDFGVSGASVVRYGISGFLMMMTKKKMSDQADKPSPSVWVCVFSCRLRTIFISIESVINLTNLHPEMS